MLSKHQRQGPRWAFMERFDVHDRADPDLVILHRLRVIETPWFALYVHRLPLPDRDRWPHDHPWPFASWVVRGGYTEDLYASPDDEGRTVHRRRWSIHRMGTEAGHRIAVVQDNTVTVIVRGRRRRTWGFWTDTGFIPYTQYGPSMGPNPFDS